ncbi:hypothetical protein MG293_014993 [Ovis ammon polii]|uniref:Uncharacterized protein n=1 Tax=Ovis ammon polii TaxID=230172 RepID=A0AAD4Y482_OVIAM|nr:hypothetical protein MG293_014993 [Ovis ammon polii]
MLVGVPLPQGEPALILHGTGMLTNRKSGPGAQTGTAVGTLNPRLARQCTPDAGDVPESHWIVFASVGIGDPATQDLGSPALQEEAPPCTPFLPCLLLDPPDTTSSKDPPEMEHSGAGGGHVRPGVMLSAQRRKKQGWLGWGVEGVGERNAETHNYSAERIHPPKKVGDQKKQGLRARVAGATIVFVSQGTLPMDGCSDALQQHAGRPLPCKA